MIFFFLVFIFNSFCSFGQQSRLLQKNSNLFIFTYKSETYLIENDSIDNISSKQKGFPKLHNLEIKDFKFVSNESVGYLKDASSGVIYNFDGNTFKRLDNSFSFKDQFYSYSFIHNKNVFDFGGYGFFNYKNLITYFNFSEKETEIYHHKNALNSIPNPRMRMMAQYDDEVLYIGPGLGIQSDIENPYVNEGLISDYWQFSFKNKTWSKLGENIIKSNYPYFFIYDYNGHSLLIYDYEIYECDIKNNILIHYPKANTDIIKAINKKKCLITYNKKKGGFYIIINKSLINKSEILFVNRSNLFGPVKVVSELYKTNKNYYFCAFVVLICIICFWLSSRKHIVYSDIFELHPSLIRS